MHMPDGSLDSTSPAVVNALSFDIEDWFHMVGIPAVDKPEAWPSFPSIVEDQTRWILDTLDEFAVKATFFMLGWVAERYPDLSGMIARRGRLGRYMVIYRTLANPAYLDPTIDPSHRPVGSIFSPGDPIIGNYGPGGLARVMTPARSA